VLTGVFFGEVDSGGYCGVLWDPVKEKQLIRAKAESITHINVEFEERFLFEMLI